MRDHDAALDQAIREVAAIFVDALVHLLFPRSAGLPGGLHGNPNETTSTVRMAALRAARLQRSWPVLLSIRLTSAISNGGSLR